MNIAFLVATIMLAISGLPCVAQTRIQHASRAGLHCGQASIHGSAAIAQGGASILAIPSTIIGVSLTVIGASLQAAGTESLRSDDDLKRAGTGAAPTATVAPADPAPTLDRQEVRATNRSKPFSLRLMLGQPGLCAAALFPPATSAGSSAGCVPLRPHAEVADFADRVQNELSTRGAHVAIVARTGRDPSRLPDGIRYTHVAFCVYSNITNADGRAGTGYRVQNLHQSEAHKARSTLVQDSPIDFFIPA